MATATSLEPLWEQVRAFGPHPFLVTTSADGAPHVVSVRVRTTDAGIVAGAGNTSRANATKQPAVSLLWPATGGAYCLIVDGNAAVDDAAETITVTPTRAVLHKLAGATGDGPSCVRLVPGDG